uniref:Uncharacterized protein n=1 Tax=Anguilla anguilla TaxID=7936 RepID=A0A0E9UD73_ANGAN
MKYTASFTNCRLEWHEPSLPLNSLRTSLALS